MRRTNPTAEIQLANGCRLLVDRRRGVANLDLIAGRQRGLISRRQMIAAGIPQVTISRLLAKAIISRTRRGVYQVGPVKSAELHRETAAILAIGRDALIVGRSALIVWQALKETSGAPVDIALQPAGARHPQPRDGIRVHRSLHLDEAQIRTHRNLRVSSFERALLDSIPVIGAEAVREAADEAVVRRVTSRTKLREFSAAHPQLQAILIDPPGANVSASDYQRKALALIREAGLPEPETEVSLFGFSADFFFADAGVVFEVDGFGPHGQKRRNFVRDRRKDAVFRAHGLTVIRAAATDLDEHPLAVIADLAAAIREGLLRRRAA